MKIMRFATSARFAKCRLTGSSYNVVILADLADLAELADLADLLPSPMLKNTHKPKLPITHSPATLRAMTSMKLSAFRRPEVLFGIVVLAFSFFTYFWNYTNPPYLYWDENYHIASAQKYLNGVYFMEPHPPLGKLLIAAGEKILNSNEEDDQFIGTDYAKDLSTGFSFMGYRFFPVLLGWLTAPLIYLIFLLATRKTQWAFLLSFLYIFDNALITHSRAAMLDSTLLFFCAAQIALYFLILEYRNHRNLFPFFSLLFGVTFACIMTTKALGLILVLLFPVLILQLRKTQRITNHARLPDGQGLRITNIFRQCFQLIHHHSCSLHWPKIAQFFTLSVSGFIIVYCAIWQIHFSLGKKIIPSLPDNGYYQASDAHKALLDSGKTNFPLMLRDHLHFLNHYATGVPTLNLCKSDENGSPFFLWPFGARSISYRWETPDGGTYRYIYLQVNPVIWGLALMGLLTAFAMLLSSVIVPSAASQMTYRKEIALWFGLWLAYMLAVSQIDRVMYLYHYFIPLIFSFILFGYVMMEVKQIGIVKLSEIAKSWMLLGCGALIFAAFHVYRPFTYYELISDEAFKRRMIFPLWELKCVHCERESMYAVPIEGEGN